jgi:VanZ family protein
MTKFQISTPQPQTNPNNPNNINRYGIFNLRFLKYWLPVIVYAILIFCISSIPGRRIPNLFSGQSEFAHVIEYAILALLVNRAVKKYYPGQSYKRRFFWVFIAVIIYAMSDEFHQFFVPQREASLYDVGMDGIGIIIANILYR